MMELAITNSSKTLSVSDAIFGREFSEDLVHQVVVAYQANARSGNRAQMTRAGMTSSPLWRGGGRIFPNKPDENFSQKVNRKMYRAGVAAILSQLAREDRLAVVENFAVDAPKTKLVAQKLKGLGLDSVLVITDSIDDNLMLASRNLPNILVLEAQQADPVSLVRFPKVLMTKAAVAKMEEMLA